MIHRLNPLNHFTQICVFRPNQQGNYCAVEPKPVMLRGRDGVAGKEESSVAGNFQKIVIRTTTKYLLVSMHSETYVLYNINFQYKTGTYKHYVQN